MGSEIQLTESRHELSVDYFLEPRPESRQGDCGQGRTYLLIEQGRSGAGLITSGLRYDQLG